MAIDGIVGGMHGADALPLAGSAREFAEAWPEPYGRGRGRCGLHQHRDETTGLRFCCRRPIRVPPVRALVFVILTPSKSSAQTARVPNAISFDGLKIDRPAVPEIGRYRAFSAG